MEPNVPAGERILSWCKVKGVSLRGLAKTTGIDKSKLHRVVKGQQPASADDLEVIARAFGLSMPEFFGAVGSVDAPPAQDA